MISWQMVMVLVAVLVTTSVLGVTHVVTSDWIERTITVIIGFTAGHALGILRTRSGNSSPPPPAAPPAPPPAAPPAAPPTSR